MELVENNAGLGKVFLHRDYLRITHVDSHRLEPFLAPSEHLP
jgi:hypothetical protein